MLTTNVVIGEGEVVERVELDVLLGLGLGLGLGVRIGVETGGVF